MFKRIGLISFSKNIATQEALKCATEYLQHNNIDYAVYDGSSKSRNIELKDVADFFSGIDLVIAIGGDGTMLQVARLLITYDVPLTGINVGRLGFLADIPANNIAYYLDDIFADKYISDQRFMLISQTFRQDKMIDQSYAFNDVIIQKENVAQLIEISTYIDDVFVHTQRSDGLIVSTPTGSTAYALSSGGPILHPTLDALALVPICPHNLSNRPIVIQGNCQVKMHCLSTSRLSCDGFVGIDLQVDDIVVVKKHVNSISLIHPATHDQYYILREKLNWSKEIC